MAEIIGSLLGSGNAWAVVAGVGLCFAFRPKTLVALAVFVVAPFKGSRLFNRYLDALAILNGVQPATRTEAEPASRRARRNRRGNR